MGQPCSLWSGTKRLDSPTDLETPNDVVRVPPCVSVAETESKNTVISGAQGRVLAFVALGSNLGDPVRNVRAAIERLAQFSVAPLRVSSLWRTTPVDCPAGSPSFVNAVAALAPQPGETPESLLVKLQALEREFGRAPAGARNAPRPLDLDLIAFGDETRRSPELMLPHPRAHQRRFVLEPLSEIAPDLVLPGQARTVAELLATLQTDERLERIE